MEHSPNQAMHPTGRAAADCYVDGKEMMSDLPTEDEFRLAANTPEILHLVIRGHGELEIALRVAIAEALVEPHELELKRLSFPFKVDLAIALGVVSNSVRPLLLRLNKARNTFAHDPRAKFTKAEAQDVSATLTVEQRENVKDYLARATRPREILRIAFVVAFFEIKGAAERVQEKKRRHQEWLRDVEDFLERGEGKKA